MYATTANSAAPRRAPQSKPPPADQHGPQRRKDHAAYTGAVVCLGECHGPVGVEPRRNDRVDAGRSQRNPASAGQHGGNEQLPRLHRCSPAQHAHGQQQRTRHRGSRYTDPPMDTRHTRHHTGAPQKMEADRRGDQR